MVGLTRLPKLLTYAGGTRSRDSHVEIRAVRGHFLNKVIIGSCNISPLRQEGGIIATYLPFSELNFLASFHGSGRMKIHQQPKNGELTAWTEGRSQPRSFKGCRWHRRSRSAGRADAATRVEAELGLRLEGREKLHRVRQTQK